MPLRDFTAIYTKTFFEDLRTLNIEPAEVYPAATDHIPEMVALIKKLQERGYTYTVDGSIYYRIDRFPRMENWPTWMPRPSRVGRVGALITTNMPKMMCAISPCGRPGPLKTVTCIGKPSWAKAVRAGISSARPCR